MSGYRLAVVVLAILVLAIGAALIVRTAAEGGGVVGFVVGGLFVTLGAARLSLERGRRRWGG